MSTTGAIGQTGTQDPAAFKDGNGFNTLKTEDFFVLAGDAASESKPAGPAEGQRASSAGLLDQLAVGQPELGRHASVVRAQSECWRRQQSDWPGRDGEKIGKSTVTGTVDKVVVEDGKVFVMVGENKVPFDKITSVEGSSNSSANAAELLAALGGGSDPPVSDLTGG